VQAFGRVSAFWPGTRCRLGAVEPFFLGLPTKKSGVHPCCFVFRSASKPLDKTAGILPLDQNHQCVLLLCSLVLSVVVAHKTRLGFVRRHSPISAGSRTARRRLERPMPGAQIDPAAPSPGNHERFPDSTHPPRPSANIRHWAKCIKQPAQRKRTSPAWLPRLGKRQHVKITSFSLDPVEPRRLLPTKQRSMLQLPHLPPPGMGMLECFVHGPQLPH